MGWQVGSLVDLPAGWQVDSLADLPAGSLAGWQADSRGGWPEAGARAASLVASLVAVREAWPGDAAA